jgi:hypothetical protein
MRQANSLPIMPGMSPTYQLYCGPTHSVYNSEEVVQLCVQMVCKLSNAYLIVLIFFSKQVVWQLGKAPGTRSPFVHKCFQVSFKDIRFVLAATEHLHRRISKLSARIRQLEDALAALHAKHSTEVHPLLHEDLMQTDERDEADTPADESMGQATQTGDGIDAFGTLSISEHGISRFFGPTGGSEVISFLILRSIFFGLTLCTSFP